MQKWDGGHEPEPVPFGYYLIESLKETPFEGEKRGNRQKCWGMYPAGPKSTSIYWKWPSAECHVYPATYGGDGGLLINKAGACLPLQWYNWVGKRLTDEKKKKMELNHDSRNTGLYGTLQKLLSTAKSLDLKSGCRKFSLPREAMLAGGPRKRRGGGGLRKSKDDVGNREGSM